MTRRIAKQIQSAQNHGRQKWGSGPKDYAHDDEHSDEDWRDMIADHNDRAEYGTPMERREELIKTAGLCVSAIESIDRFENRKYRKRREK